MGLAKKITHPLRRVARQVPGLSPALGRVFEPSVDAFVISFPKCGRTWLQVQLGRVIERHFGLDADPGGGDVVDVEGLAGRAPGAPRIRMLHADKPHRKRPDELNPAVLDYFRHRKVVLLIRDPRDVVVSLYMHRIKRGMKHPFEGTLADFLDEPIGGFDTLLRYYELWAERQGRNLLIVRYEDMQLDPAKELWRVLEFIGLGDVADEVVADAVAFSSFDRMREMERRGAVDRKQLQPGDPDDEESFKTRRGKVGGYVDYLDAAQIAELDRRMREKLHAFYGESARP